MATDWQTELYRVYKNELATGLDQFLTRVVGENWIEILIEKDRTASTRNGQRQLSRTHSRTDLQASLRILSESFPNAPKLRAQLSRNSEHSREGLA